MATEWHGYAVIEITQALTGPQKQKLRAALRALGSQSDASPARITHMRARLDNQAVLLELVVPTQITKNDFINALATELGISRAMLDAKTNLTAFPGADWEARRQAAVAYLKANAAAWEPLI